MIRPRYSPAAPDMLAAVGVEALLRAKLATAEAAHEADMGRQEKQIADLREEVRRLREKDQSSH